MRTGREDTVWHEAFRVAENMACQCQILNLDLSRASYVLYGVKYIGPVSLALIWPVNLTF